MSKSFKWVENLIKIRIFGEVWMIKYLKLSALLFWCTGWINKIAPYWISTYDLDQPCFPKYWEFEIQTCRGLDSRTENIFHISHSLINSSFTRNESSFKWHPAYFYFFWIQGPFWECLGFTSTNLMAMNEE